MMHSIESASPSSCIASRDFCFDFQAKSALARSLLKLPEGNRPDEEELGMAKQERVLPARKPGDRSRDDDSMLLRSAESLGRVIGALQRQLDGVTKRMSNPNGDSAASRVKRRIVRKATAKKRTSAARKTSVKKR
jgi:hypothetical protein